MKRWYDPIWVAIAIVLSIVVAIVGYPAFPRQFGFPLALLWTLACVAGVWLTHFIRGALRGKHK